ncbi:MAG: TonB-dependent receptor [Gammaproteobacteria bacterium]|nr:TonB-dependent receptor [Gammaproteobacteria bacterium]
MKTIHYLFTLSFFIFNTYAHSAQSVKNEHNTNSDDEAALLMLLQEETEIATKTRLNADFVPGMVTVLHGDELLQQGVLNVWQALGRVPGMEATLDKIGSRIVKVRGIGGSFASGNLKIMLNNVAMNSTLSALSQPVMNMPIEQIERIEVMRGPGSAIHGEFAYAGVVNVITHTQKKMAFAGIAEHDSSLAGGVWNWSNKENRFNASLNLATSETDGADVKQGTDALHLTGAQVGMNQSAISYAPGRATEDREYHSLLFNLDYHDFSLSAQWLEDENGAHFGTVDVLPPPNGNDHYKNEFKTLEAMQQFKFSDTISSDVKVGWLEYVNKFDITALPPGYSFPVTLNDGFLSDGYYKEEKYYTNINLFWNASEQNAILLAFEYSKTEVKDAWQDNNVSPLFVPLNEKQRFTGEDGVNWPEEGQSREISSITLQDELRLTEDLAITFGVRYDHYDDIGDNASPRLAAVYRLNERHIIKGQYAQAFRPPTFFEMVYTPDIEPEIIDTYDIGYIYKGVKTGFKTTAFYSKLDDIIVGLNPYGFENSQGATIKGIEFELDHKFNNKVSFDGNLSYSDSKDDATKRSIAGTSNWLSNLSLNYQPVHYFDFSITYQYVGSKYREQNDPRDKLDAYGVVNLAATFSDLLGKGTALQIGVNNLFDEDVRYPAPMTTDMTGFSFPAYEEDYQRSNSWWWARFQYEF